MVVDYNKEKATQLVTETSKKFGKPVSEVVEDFKDAWRSPLIQGLIARGFQNPEKIAMDSVGAIYSAKIGAKLKTYQFYCVNPGNVYSKKDKQTGDLTGEKGRVISGIARPKIENNGSDNIFENTTIFVNGADLNKIDGIVHGKMYEITLSGNFVAKNGIIVLSVSPLTEYHEVPITPFIKDIDNYFMSLKITPITQVLMMHEIPYVVVEGFVVSSTVNNKGFMNLKLYDGSLTTEDIEKYDGLRVSASETFGTISSGSLVRVAGALSTHETYGPQIRASLIYIIANPETQPDESLYHSEKVNSIPKDVIVNEINFDDKGVEKGLEL